MAEKPTLLFADAASWRDWLGRNVGVSDGVVLQLARKGTEGLHAPDALDIALCFGWIDGVRRGLNETHFLQSYGPRRSRSLWSQVNREHTDRLIRDGLMTPHGLAEIDRAKADGRWDAAYRQKNAEVPADLRAALDASPVAAAFFSTLSSQNRFSILFRIGQLRRAETRAAKIAGYVEMLGRGETIYPQRARS